MGNPKIWPARPTLSRGCAPEPKEWLYRSCQHYPYKFVLINGPGNGPVTAGNVKVARAPNSSSVLIAETRSTVTLVGSRARVRSLPQHHVPAPAPENLTSVDRVSAINTVGAAPQNLKSGYVSCGHYPYKFVLCLHPTSPLQRREIGGKAQHQHSSRHSSTTDTTTACADGGAWPRAAAGQFGRFECCSECLDCGTGYPWVRG